MLRKDLQAREDRAFRLRLLAAEPEVRRRLGRIPLLQRACTPLYAVSGDSNTVSFRALLGTAVSPATEHRQNFRPDCCRGMSAHGLLIVRVKRCAVS